MLSHSYRAVAEIAHLGEVALTEEATRSGTIDRLYVLNGGVAVAPDRSVYTPGKWEGEQVTLSCNAYLIRPGGKWIMGILASKMRLPARLAAGSLPTTSAALSSAPSERSLPISVLRLRMLGQLFISCPFRSCG